MSFDTLAYANRMKAAGVPPVIAEAQAEANAALVGSLIDGVLATKQDLAMLESKFEYKIKESENRLTLRLGGIVVGSLGILTTVMSVLHLASH